MRAIKLTRYIQFCLTSSFTVFQIIFSSANSILFLPFIFHKLRKLMKKTSTFKKRNSGEIYHINKPLNCNSKNTVYLIEYNQC